MAIFINCSKAANKCEERFFDTLTNNLPEDWAVLGNASLVQKTRSQEVDAIVIGGGKVWGLEAKCWKGSISGDSHTWIWSNGKSCRSPINVVRDKARVLATFAHEAGVTTYVDGFVVLLAEPRNELNIVSPDLKFAVFYHDEIVNKLISLSAGSEIDSAIVKKLIKSIGGYDAVNIYQKKCKLKKTNKTSDDIRIKPNEIENNDAEEYIFKLYQPENCFSRTYYSSEFTKVFLGKEELRGAVPPLWRNWYSNGLYLHLSPWGISLEAIEGSVCLINGISLPFGKSVSVTHSSGMLEICGISFNYKAAIFCEDDEK